MTARHDDFDAFIREGEPVYAWTLAGTRFEVFGVDLEAFDKMIRVGATLDQIPDEDKTIAMLRAMKEMVRDQLEFSQRDAWMATRPPYKVLAAICERITEAATGRPFEALPTSGEQSAETGQPSSPPLSVPGILPPPSAG